MPGFNKSREGPDSTDETESTIQTLTEARGSVNRSASHVRRRSHMNGQRPETRTILDRVIDSIERMLGRKTRLVPAPVRIPARRPYPTRIPSGRRF